jgi:hypothetical protein
MSEKGETRGHGALLSGALRAEPCGAVRLWCSGTIGGVCIPMYGPVLRFRKPGYAPSPERSRVPPCLP